MKKLLLFGFFIFLVSCKETGFDGKHYELNKSINTFSVFRVIEIDSCEYISYNLGADGGMLTHKGNCKYCAQRQHQ